MKSYRDRKSVWSHLHVFVVILMTLGKVVKTSAYVLGILNPYH